MCVYIFLTFVAVVFGTKTKHENWQYIKTNVSITNASMYSHYPHLSELDMSNQVEFEFPAHQVLLDHGELSRFVCNNCGIHTIYQESLSKLPLLSHLTLINNSIAFVHPDAFALNDRLENVDLTGNRLSTFNSEATIRHIHALNILVLSRNKYFDLNQITLNATGLLYFTCNYCDTVFMHQNTLTSMPELRELNLSYNAIESFADDALKFSKINVLNIDGNRNLLRLNLNSRSLKTLSAEGCNLEGTLYTSKLPLLEYINVRMNRISAVHENGFIQVKNIKTILLDDNLITKLPTTLLKLPLNGLTRLCMDSNPFQPSPDVYEGKQLYWTRLLRRDCLDDGNHFGQFENYLSSGGGLAVYKKTYQHINKELVIDLRNRNIVYIEPDYIFEKWGVPTLLFDNNHLFDFSPVAFLISFEIERLSLENCAITNIYSATFEKIPYLKFLHLDGNNINFIYSNVFESNKKLEFLSLSYNNLTFLDIKAVGSLKTLILDGNNRLAAFLTSVSLRKLSCMYCGFTRLDNVTISMPNLVELNFNHNKIETIDYDILYQTTELEHLYLRSNHLVRFELNINQMANLKTLCLANNFNFDYEHFNFDVKKMMQLDKNCSDNKFSDKLVSLYRTRNKNKVTTNNKNESLKSGALPLSLSFLSKLIFFYLLVIN